MNPTFSFSNTNALERSISQPHFGQSVGTIATSENGRTVVSVLVPATNTRRQIYAFADIDPTAASNVCNLRILFIHNGSRVFELPVSFNKVGNGFAFARDGNTTQNQRTTNCVTFYVAGVLHSVPVHEVDVICDRIEIYADSVTIAGAAACGLAVISMA